MPSLKKHLVPMGTVGIITYIIYKVVLPSEDDIKRHMEKPLYDGGSNFTTCKGQQLGRVLELSSQGFSYQAITKIIQKENKLKYQQMYAEEQKKIREHQEAAAKATGLQFPSVDIRDIVQKTSENIVGGFGSRS